MNFEKQLESIRDKAALRAWVDDLPDNVAGVILTRREEDGEPVYSYKSIGGATVERTLYITKSFEHYLFGLMDTD